MRSHLTFISRSNRLCKVNFRQKTQNFTWYKRPSQLIFGINYWLEIPRKYHKIVRVGQRAGRPGPENRPKSFFSLKIFFFRTETGRVKLSMVLYCPRVPFFHLITWSSYLQYFFCKSVNNIKLGEIMKVQFQW